MNSDFEGKEFHSAMLDSTGKSFSDYSTRLIPLYIENAGFYIDGLYQQINKFWNGIGKH